MQKNFDDCPTKCTAPNHTAWVDWVARSFDERHVSGMVWKGCDHVADRKRELLDAALDANEVVKMAKLQPKPGIVEPLLRS
jgi:hypothetical protein